MEKPILFFCIRNDFCKRYYYNYIHQIRDDVQLIDLELPENKVHRQSYSVDTVPTVIVLDGEGKQMMRWSGGKPIDAKKIQVELAMRKYYG
jgi:hypothetical protein